MAAPKENQFWKLRSKHGRKRIFETPDIMMEAAYEYFEHQSKQKWDRVDFKGKDVEEVKIPTASPFTITGLCIFLGVNSVYFNRFEEEREKEDTQEAKDFCKVITHIREIIFTQKFEGAAVGAYNSNIVARSLGLGEKVDHTTKGESLNDKYSNLTDEELEQANAKFERRNNS